MGTPCNNTILGEIAKTMLMPGDPLGAEFTVKNWLTDAKLVSRVRNIYAFTGKFEGKEVAVMVGGTGTPSIGIYSYELFTQYSVERTIRIDSAGVYSERLKLYDVVLAEGCWNESSFGQTQNGGTSDIRYPNPELNQVILEAGNKYGIEVVPVKIHPNNVFYSELEMDSFQKIYTEHGSGCVETESFALLHSAKMLGEKVACLSIVSDSFITRERITVEERQGALDNMMKVVLKTATAVAD